MAGRQVTLGFFPGGCDVPLATTPPIYRHHNDPPTTVPTLIAVCPTPPQPATPDPTPPPGEQAELTRFAGPCPFCTADPPNVQKHVLEAHPDELSAYIEKRHADRTQQISEPEPTDDPIPEPEPAMFGTVEPAPPGQQLDAPDARACNDCGERMSRDYARVFGWEDGSLWCPNCKPRSQRYSNDPSWGGDGPDNLDLLTGANNSQASTAEPND